jgi:polyisoprenoid-binding protein YceI
MHRLLFTALALSMITSLGHGQENTEAVADHLVTAPQEFKVDPVHSTVLFRIQHFNAGQYYGRINDPQGTFTLDPAGPKLDVTLEAAKVDTANAKRDEHLRSPDFFNARQYPTITFKSTSAEKTGENTYKVNGELTLLGQTKPVTATVETFGPAQDPRGTTRAGAEAIFTIKRSDFGMNFMPGGLGDEVRIIASVEGTQGQ